MLPKMPKFETEAQEAEWWYEQRHVLDEEFARLKPRRGPGGAMMELAKVRGISVEELRRQIEAKRSDSTVRPELPRSA